VSVESRDKTLQQFGCDALLADLERSDNTVAQLLLARAQLEDELGMTKAQALEAETIAALGVEGKNEMERKAQKALLLQRDVAYQGACLEVRRVEAKIAQVDADLESAKRKSRRLEHTIAFRCAALRFLGGAA
jgi:hypothetical protein